MVGWGLSKGQSALFNHSRHHARGGGEGEGGRVRGLTASRNLLIFSRMERGNSERAILYDYWNSEVGIVRWLR